MCSERRKNHGCGQKKPKSTSSAIFGVETAAKSCELKRCADRVRTELTFRFPPKRQLSILLNFIFPLTNLFLTFVVFACFSTTRVNIRFRAKTHGIQHSRLYEVYEVYWYPCGAHGRTYGHVTNTSLPKFLGLIGYQIWSSADALAPLKNSSSFLQLVRKDTLKYSNTTQNRQVFSSVLTKTPSVSNIR